MHFILIFLAPDSNLFHVEQYWDTLDQFWIKIFQLLHIKKIFFQKNSPFELF